MPEIVRPDGARIHYEVHGAGFPVLLLAPGGASSETGSWESNFYHPVRELAEHFQVIAMDQRHAGRSPAPAQPFRYEQSAGDQLAVLDELHVDQAHLVSAGIGCAHAWRLTHDAPGRVRAVVCQQPVGRDDSNTLGTYYGPYDEAMRHARAEGVSGVITSARQDGRFERNPGAGPFAQRLHDDETFRTEIGATRRENYITLLVRFRDGIWPDGASYFSVPDAWMGEFPAPMLVLPGDDPLHPAGVAKRLGQEVPRARLLDPGYDAEDRRARSIADVIGFLHENTPGRQAR